MLKYKNINSCNILAFHLSVLFSFLRTLVEFIYKANIQLNIMVVIEKKRTHTLTNKFYTVEIYLKALRVFEHIHV